MSVPSLTLTIDNVSVCRSGSLIVDGVSFTAEPSSLTAVIGPNGAGKTTLFKAICGERPDMGRVLLNEHSLYDAPEYWLRQIGYVPVDNVLHEQLTVLQALMFVAELRNPAASAHELSKRVSELLVEFGFSETDTRRDSRIRDLSSGERKRLNICAELLTNPPLLLLDEPTSNLDPDAERDLMTRLAERAHKGGQTILVITHTLNTIDACDKVVFVQNAVVGAIGSPDSTLSALEAANTRKGPGGAPLSKSLFDRWARVFETYKTQPGKRAACPPGTGRQRSERQGVSSTNGFSVTDTSFGAQFFTLLRRYAQIRWNDKRGLLLTLSLGLIGGLFLFVLPDKAFVEPENPNDIALAISGARQSVFIVALVVSLIGLIASFVEISREYRIYSHERLKGLSTAAYLLSKWLWLVVAVGITAPVLLFAWMLLVLGQPMPFLPVGEASSVAFSLIGLVLACIASITVGLLISAVAAGSGKESLLLAIVVIFLVLFSGLIRNANFETLINTLSNLATSRWAFDAYSASLSFYCWAGKKRFDEYNSIGHHLSIWLSLVVYVIVAMALAWVALRLRDPWQKLTGNLRGIVARQKVAWLCIGIVILALLTNVGVFRRQSAQFHDVGFFSRVEYGGTGGYEYAQLAEDRDWGTAQRLNAALSESWCSDNAFVKQVIQVSAR